MARRISSGPSALLIGDEGNTIDTPSSGEVSGRGGLLRFCLYVVPMNEPSDGKPGCLEEQTLAGWVAGALSAAEAEAADAHLVTCSRCRIIADALKSPLHEGASPSAAVKTPALPAGLVPTETGVTEPPSPPLPMGSIIGRYVVLSLLGEGGMGSVYVAYDPQLDRRVALKFLKTGKRAGVSTAWLLREAKNLARLTHPHVVAVHDLGQLPDGNVFIAMELVEGVSLRAWLRAAPRSWREVCAVMLEAGRGLQAAHAVGLVHRDFKPDNVVVGVDGRAKVLDFGVAKPLDAQDLGASRGLNSAPPPADPSTPTPLPPAGPPSSASSGPTEGATVLTEAGSLVGTLAYMAPEYLETRIAGVGNDVFAFGVSLFEALYGERPYRTSLKAPRPSWEPVAVSRPELPASVQAVVQRAISLDPAARFATMSDLVGALEKAIGPPGVPRGRVAIAGTLLLIAAVGAVAVGRREEVRVCQGAGAPIAATWSPARRAAVETRFTALEAADTFARVDRRVGDVQAAWSSLKVDACLAAQATGAERDALFDARTRCLERRQLELESLLALFETADASLVRRAVQALVELPPVSMCATAELALSMSRPPAALAPTVEEAARLLSRGWAELSAGDTGAAVARAEAARSLAAGHAATLAETFLLEGRAVALGSPDRAIAVFEASTRLAAAAGDEVAALQALLDLARAHFRKGEYATQLEVLEATRFLFVRLGEPVRFRPQVVSAFFLARVINRRLVAGGSDFEAALAEVKALEGADPLQLAQVHTNLGSGLVSAGLAEQALPSMEQALVLRIQELGPDHFDVIAARYNLAVAHASLARWTAALTHLDPVLAWCETAGERGEALCLYTRAAASTVYPKVSPPRGADALLDAVLTSAQRGEAQRQMVYGPLASNVIMALRLSGRLDEAVAFSRDALAALDANEAQGRVNRSAFGQYGLTLWALGRRAEARRNLELALEPGGSMAIDEYELAELRYGLAQLLEAGSPAERSQASGLVKQAREGFSRLGLQEKVTQLDAWTKARGQSP
jgi:eukaryotic-like serine/threonine-protein kinase